MTAEEARRDVSDRFAQTFAGWQFWEDSCVADLMTAAGGRDVFLGKVRTEFGETPPDEVLAKSIGQLFDWLASRITGDV